MNQLSMLVPTSGSVPAQDAAEYICVLAQSLDAEIILLHVHSDSRPSDDGVEAAEIFFDVAQDLDLEIEVIYRQGDPVKQILRVAAEESVSLIVMGGSGKASVDEWLSADVHEMTEIPVVVIPRRAGTE